MVSPVIWRDGKAAIIPDLLNVNSVDVSQVELSYLDGATSNIQSQINALGGGWTTNASTSIAALSGAWVELTSASDITIAGATNCVIYKSTASRLTFTAAVVNCTVINVGPIDYNATSLTYSTIITTGTFQQTLPVSGSLTASRNTIICDTFTTQNSSTTNTWTASNIVARVSWTGATSTTFVISGCKLQTASANTGTGTTQINGCSDVAIGSLTTSGTWEITGDATIKITRVSHGGSATFSYTNDALLEIGKFTWTAAGSGGIRLRNTIIRELILQKSISLDLGTSTLTANRIAIWGEPSYINWMSTTGTLTVLGVTSDTIPTGSRNITLDTNIATWIENTGAVVAYDKAT
jgi:hypothetical protein